MTRRRVRLTATDWRVIAETLREVIGCPTSDDEERYARRVFAKIGVDGMAAARRGVAPVRRTR